jgi:hypothetical protein
MSIVSKTGLCALMFSMYNPVGKACFEMKKVLSII